MAYTSRRAAHQDYGSGESAPPGQKPHEQTGKNPSEDKEHPGPPPPSTGNKGGQQQQGSQQQGGQQKDASSQQQSGRSKGTQDAQPKILNESPPHQDHAPDEVKQHNQELDGRAEKANEKVRDEDYEKDKVGKGFWAGTW